MFGLLRRTLTWCGGWWTAINIKHDESSVVGARCHRNKQLARCGGRQKKPGDSSIHRWCDTRELNRRRRRQHPGDGTPLKHHHLWSSGRSGVGRSGIENRHESNCSRAAAAAASGERQSVTLKEYFAPHTKVVACYLGKFSAHGLLTSDTVGGFVSTFYQRMSLSFTRKYLFFSSDLI